MMARGTSISGREDDNSQPHHTRSLRSRKYIRERRRQFPTCARGVLIRWQVYQGEKTTIPNPLWVATRGIASISGREDDNSQRKTNGLSAPSKYIRERRRQFPTQMRCTVDIPQVYQGEKTTIPNYSRMDASMASSISGREDDNSQHARMTRTLYDKYIRERRRQFPTYLDGMIKAYQVYQGEKTTIPNYSALCVCPSASISGREDDNSQQRLR